MPFGDISLDAPKKPFKGMEGGACNVRSCQAEPALWWNHGSHAWYCAACADQIGGDHVNEHGWYINFARYFPRQERFPQFETRPMMLERIEKGAGVHTMPKVTFDSDVPPEVIIQKLHRTIEIASRQQSKTVEQGKTVEQEDGNASQHPVYENRQQRRAAERAAFKRLPKRS